VAISIGAFSLSDTAITAPGNYITGVVDRDSADTEPITVGMAARLSRTASVAEDPAAWSGITDTATCGWCAATVCLRPAPSPTITSIDADNDTVDTRTGVVIVGTNLPTAETVNTLRLGKFAERITETLESEDVAAFRDLIASYEEEHNVPASEIAAALAVMAQGGQPLLVKELPAAPEFQKRERSKDGFGSRGPTRTLTEGNATYRIAVGRRQRVMPGSIVGAIANEGGISSAQIGGIDIRADHSLVELPADLSSDQLKALSRTRIGGELIHLELDNGRKPSGDRGSYQGGSRGGDRGGYSGGGDRGGNFKGNGGFKREFRKNDGERSSADRGGRSFSDRNERGVGSDAARKPRTEGGFKPRNKW
jgi:ATP-dependent RNA helicase DeaD